MGLATCLNKADIPLLAAGLDTPLEDLTTNHAGAHHSSTLLDGQDVCNMSMQDGGLFMQLHTGLQHACL